MTDDELTPELVAKVFSRVRKWAENGEASDPIVSAGIRLRDKVTEAACSEHWRAKLEAAERKISDQDYTIDRISNLSEKTHIQIRERAEAAERERDELRAEVERLRQPARDVATLLSMCITDHQGAIHPGFEARAKVALGVLDKAMGIATPESERKVPRRDPNKGEPPEGYGLNRDDCDMGWGWYAHPGCDGQHDSGFLWPTREQAIADAWRHKRAWAAKEQGE